MLCQNLWARQCRGIFGQRQSQFAYVVPVITARVVLIVLSAFLLLPTAADGGTLAGVPSFTSNTISNGGCVYAYGVKAVDVTGDGFVDVLAGTIELNLCVGFKAPSI